MNQSRFGFASVLSAALAIGASNQAAAQQPGATSPQQPAAQTALPSLPPPAAPPAAVPAAPAAPPAPPVATPVPTPMQPAPAAAAPPPGILLTYHPDSNAVLERRIQVGGVAKWQPLCRQACTITADPRFVYRVSGDGVVDSDQFQLTPGTREVLLEAEVKSRTALVGGYIMLYGGGLIGLSALAVAATGEVTSTEYTSEGTRREEKVLSQEARNGALIAGGVALAVGAVGLVLVLTNHETNIRMRTSDGVRTPVAAAPRFKLAEGLWLTPAGLSF